LLVFGRKDVKVEAKGESFAHRQRWRIGGQRRRDIVPFATSRTKEVYLSALLPSSTVKNEELAYKKQAKPSKVLKFYEIHSKMYVVTLHD
jgi:hypothetical protein